MPIEKRGLRIAILDDSKMYAERLDAELQIAFDGVSRVDVLTDRASIVAFQPEGYHIILVDYHLFGGYGFDSPKGEERIDGYDLAISYAKRCPNAIVALNSGDGELLAKKRSVWKIFNFLTFGTKPEIHFLDKTSPRYIAELQRLTVEYWGR
jgi:hypothetical protein